MLKYILFQPLKKMKATNEFVCLQLNDPKQDKKGFQVMADPSKNNLQIGQIVSVGEEVSIDFKKGQKVLFDSFKAVQFAHNGQNYYFVKGETIFAIL